MDVRIFNLMDYVKHLCALSTEWMHKGIVFVPIFYLTTLILLTLATVNSGPRFRRSRALLFSLE